MSAHTADIQLLEGRASFFFSWFSSLIRVGCMCEAPFSWSFFNYWCFLELSQLSSCYSWTIFSNYSFSICIFYFVTIFTIFTFLCYVLRLFWARTGCFFMSTYFGPFMLELYAVTVPVITGIALMSICFIFFSTGASWAGMVKGLQLLWRNVIYQR